MSLLEGVRGKIPVAMTVAGSDSGGGAGIEADLKTFAALGVHGTVALTAITAQNTYSVTAVQDVDPEVVAKQIDAVAEDLGIDAAKTGMLHTSDIIKTVAAKVEEHGFPLVVDPVMVAKSGAPLLRDEAVEALARDLIPLAKVVTPNAREAEILAGIRVASRSDMVEAAKRIAKLGPEAVVVKGGHVELEDALDILYYRGEVYEFRAPRLESKSTHGTGCSFSAAIAAELAKGSDIVKAVRVAKEVVRAGIAFGLPVGKGYGPVNPMALLYKEAYRYRVLKSVERAVEVLTTSPLVERLAPEVGMNVVEALPYAETLFDVAGIPGRLRATGRGLRAATGPDFGASSHLARYVLEARKYDPEVRAAVNLRFSEELLEVLESMELCISYYDRREEPEEVKRREGATIPWGVRKAVEKVGRVPDVVYHRGDWGKEPMVVLLGKSAEELATLVVKVAEKLSLRESRSI